VGNDKKKLAALASPRWATNHAPAVEIPAPHHNDKPSPPPRPETREPLTDAPRPFFLYRRGIVIPGLQREDRFRVGAGVGPPGGDAREPESIDEEGGREAWGLPLPPAVPQGRPWAGRGWVGWSRRDNAQ